MDFPLGHFNSWLFWKAAGVRDRATETLERVVRSSEGYSFYLVADCLKCPDPATAQNRFESVATGLDRNKPLVRIAQAHLEANLTSDEAKVRQLVDGLLTHKPYY